MEHQSRRREQQMKHPKESALSDEVVRKEVGLAVLLFGGEALIEGCQIALECREGRLRQPGCSSINVAPSRADVCRYALPNLGDSERL